MVTDTSKKLFCLALALLLISCQQGQRLEIKDGIAVVPIAGKSEAVATFAGGCFWSMQECMVELKGVNKVISGYAGGTAANPSYEEVTGQKTGHAEAVQVYYDPHIITFEILAAAFFKSHDPTQVDGQGPDIGTDYRSVAFYRTEEERNVIEHLISEINSEGGYLHPVATETMPFEVFYGAEDYHQDYYKKHTWEPYIRQVSKPKVLKLRKAMPDFIKTQYRD